MSLHLRSLASSSETRGSLPLRILGKGQGGKGESRLPICSPVALGLIFVKKSPDAGGLPIQPLLGSSSTQQRYAQKTLKQLPYSTPDGFQKLSLLGS